MTVHNSGERQSASNKLKMLSPIGDEQASGYRQTITVGEDVYDSSYYRMYPEAFQPQPTAESWRVQQRAKETYPTQWATSTFQNVLGSQAVRDTALQTPTTYAPVERIPENAPQGPFGQDFRDEQTERPQPGFEDLHRLQTGSGRQDEIEARIAQIYASFEDPQTGEYQDA